MTGIVFFGTTDLDRIVTFYRERFGFDVWLEQPECTILRYDNLLVGFCERASAETEGLVTVVYETRDAVEDCYERLDAALRTEPVAGVDDPPTENDPYEIYNFFGTDPDGRGFEVQTFLHETDPV